MIKIGIDIDTLNSMATNFYQDVEKKLAISQVLETKINTSKSIQETTFYKELKINLPSLVTGTPQKLEAIIETIQPLYETFLQHRVSTDIPIASTPTTIHAKRIQVKDEVLKVFGYSKFVSFAKGTWAYEHAESLKLEVCPYCNMQYTFTIQTEEKKTRPHFDHFYYKDKYPYLSISFFNLIPSCYSCNSSLKRTNNFMASTHIHPFIEGTDDLLTFATKVQMVDYLMGERGFNLYIEKVIGAESSNIDRAEKNYKAFIIQEQYSFHKEYIGQIIKKAYFYNDSKLEEFMNDYELEPGKKLFNSKQEIIEMLFSIDDQNGDKHHTRVLSKLTRDLLIELGVLLK